MKTKLFGVAVILAATAAVQGVARAGSTSWSIGLSLFSGGFCAPAPVCVAPAPVYAVPTPVYVAQQAPVYMAPPAPVYVAAPTPVYVASPVVMPAPVHVPPPPVYVAAPLVVSRPAYVCAPFAPVRCAPPVRVCAPAFSVGVSHVHRASPVFMRGGFGGPHGRCR